jgi:Putative zinc-finger
MNCQEWEERIALQVSGDAARGEAAEIERHIAECAGCQAFASSMKQSVGLLRDAHQEEIAPAHYAAVRARVLTQLQEQRAWWRQLWVYGVAALAVAALLMMVWPHAETRQVAVKPPVGVKTPAPGAPDTVPEASQVAAATQPENEPGEPPVRQPAVRRARSARQPAESLLVKLETDNPDVVIYWIADRKGD